MTSDYDVLITGAGMVGASLACGLAGSALRVGVVEAVPAGAPDQPSYDDRVVALSLGSRRILGGLGVWDRLAGSATAIRAVHVSDRGRFGFTRLRAEQEGVEALGFVVEARQVGAALSERLAAAGPHDLLCPAGLVALTQDERSVVAELRGEGVPRRVSARLLVAADGGRSVAREAAGIGVAQWAYGQTALIANVSPARPHQGVAYERFTDAGPLALLPMSEGRCALVWTVASEQAAGLLALDDPAFLDALQARFGDRLGRFLRVGRRHAYPLTLLRAETQARGRVVVIGNAAHTLHPVAGQGYNLGLRDVAVLAQVILDAVRSGEDPGAAAVLERYTAWRDADQRSTARFTDGLARLFSSRSTLLGLARNTGLVALDLAPALKHTLARRAMGLAGRQPRLARGLPL